MITAQRRLVGAYLLFIIFPVVFSGSVVYTTVNSVFRAMSGRQALRMLKATDLALRTSLREVDAFSDMVITSDSVQVLLNAGNRADVRNRVDLGDLERRMVGLLTGNGRIVGAALYGKEGLLLGYGAPAPIPLDRFWGLFSFLRARSAQGRPVWLGPFENAEVAGGADRGLSVITQVRLVKDYYLLEDIGYLVLHVDKSLVENVFFELFRGEEDGVYLLSPDHQVLFGNGEEAVGERLAVFDAAPQDKEGFFFSSWGGERVLAAYLRSDTGWTLATLSSWARLERTGALFRSATLLLLLPVLAAAFLLNFSYMRRFSLFVDSLSRAMHRLRGGDLSVRLPPARGREYAMLSEDFNSMAERIGELGRDIVREQAVKKEAEFRMLQAQIKPHFLYNTLESINALASMNGQTEIHRIAVNLGKLLRLSIARDDYLSVADEVAHARAYLEIQKIRYRGRFEYGIEVEAALARQRVIKLVLQPLVENALYHGLDAFESGGRISVEARIERRVDRPAVGVFTVRDNGPGIPGPVLERLAAAAAGIRSEGAEGLPELGHGLVNVRERLAIAYGHGYGLLICDNGDGTIARIRFPIEGGES